MSWAHHRHLHHPDSRLYKTERTSGPVLFSSGVDLHHRNFGYRKIGQRFLGQGYFLETVRASLLNSSRMRAQTTLYWSYWLIRASWTRHLHPPVAVLPLTHGLRISAARRSAFYRPPKSKIRTGYCSLFLRFKGADGRRNLAYYVARPS